jgi:hypothetical protein
MVTMHIGREYRVEGQVQGWLDLVARLFTCAWWIGLWDLHAVKSWDIGSIAFYFPMAADRHTS